MGGGLATGGGGAWEQQDTLKTNYFHNFLEGCSPLPGFPFMLRNEKYGREETEAGKGVKEAFIHLFNWVGLINSMNHPLNDSLLTAG